MLKNDDLQTELKKRGLSAKGLKVELQQRLCQAMTDRVPVLKESNLEAPENDDSFIDGAMWEVLMGDKLVDDPCKALFREPTLSQELADLEFKNVKKRNYKEVFDQLEFTGVYYTLVLNIFKKQVYNKDIKNTTI